MNIKKTFSLSTFHYKKGIEYMEDYAMQEQIRSKSCCFTGHRQIPKGDMKWLPEMLDISIARRLEAGCTRFLAGGAIGFDMMCAQKILLLRESRPEVELILRLPSRDWDNCWHKDLRKTYKGILALANEVSYEADSYIPECMQLRNHRMVDESSYCIAYCRRSKGGAASTLRYAWNKDLRTENLADFWMRPEQLALELP